MGNDVNSQINRATTLDKVAGIATQRIADLVSELKNRLRFVSPQNEIEGVAFAALAKAIGTAESVVVLSRRAHWGDVLILSRALMEVAYRTVWMLAEEGEQERRLLMLYYQDAYGMLRQIKGIVEAEPGSFLANRVGNAEAHVIRYRQVIEKRYPDIKFSEAGKMRVGLSFEEILTALEQKMSYPLIYTTLSSPAHGDIRSLAHHVVQEDDAVRYPVHGARPDPSAGPLAAHSFLVFLAGNVDDKVRIKLATDFQARMEDEGRVNVALHKRVNEIRCPSDLP